jgi:hypothetical protein
MDAHGDGPQPAQVRSDTMRRGLFTVAWWFGSVAIVLLVTVAWASGCLGDPAQTNCDDAFAMGWAVMFAGPVVLVLGFVIAFGVLTFLADITRMRNGIVAGSIAAVVGLVGPPLLFLAPAAMNHLFG